MLPELVFILETLRSTRTASLSHTHEAFAWNNSPPGSRLLLDETGRFGEAVLSWCVVEGRDASIRATAVGRDVTFLPETCTSRSARESGGRGHSAQLYYNRHPAKETEGRSGAKGRCCTLKNYLLLQEPHLKPTEKVTKEPVEAEKSVQACAKCKPTFCPAEESTL